MNSTQLLNLSGNGEVESCDHDMKQKYVSICGSSRPGREQASIDPITYRGTVCWEELNLLKHCLLDDSNENNYLLVITVDNVGDAESALSAVDDFALPECAAEVKPFLCLYFFGLMSDTSNRVYYRSSAGHCKSLRDDVCELEWNLAQTLSGLELPDCDEQFPSHTVLCDEERGKELYHAFPTFKL